MKKALSLLLAATLLLGLAACGGGATDAAQSSTDSSSSTTGDGLKVAMLLPGGATSHNESNDAYNGLRFLEDALEADIYFTESVTPSQAEKEFRRYAEMGCDIVYGVGESFGEAALAVAPDYPDTFFILTAAVFENPPNVASLQAVHDEQGFIAGAIAALESESGIVGVVGGEETPATTLFVESFANGATYIWPEVTVLSVYTGDSDNAIKVKKAALAMIEKGADIVSHSAGEAGLGLFEAVEERTGVLAVGSGGDQYPLAPGKVITSVVPAMSNPVYLSAKAYTEDELTPVVIYHGVADGAIQLADFRDYPISDEHIATIEETLDKIAMGDIVV